MKKTYNNKKINIFVFSLLIICLFLFNTGCGLDVQDIIIKESPRGDLNSNVDFSSEFSNRIIDFNTKELDFGSKTPLGSEEPVYIYYKIYNSKTLAESEISDLKNMTENEQNKMNSASKMIETYQYQPIKYSKDEKIKEFSLKNADGMNVSLRLTTYLDTDYQAFFKVDNTAYGVPVRKNGYTFDFVRDKEHMPISGDDDTKGFVETQTEDDEGIYYVALFTVCIVYNENFNRIFSPVGYLGSVAINSNNEEN